MGIIAVLVAAAAAYAFGAVWYMVMAKPWMAAAGLTEDMIDNKNPKPFIISGIAVILVAGMMRHTFATSSVDTVMEGLVSGFGMGAFIARHVLHPETDRGGAGGGGGRVRFGDDVDAGFLRLIRRHRDAAFIRAFDG